MRFSLDSSASVPLATVSTVGLRTEIVTISPGQTILYHDDGSYVILDEVPTVSEWGLIVMVLLLLVAGTVVFARRHRPVVA